MQARVDQRCESAFIVGRGPVGARAVQRFDYVERIAAQPLEQHWDAKVRRRMRMLSGFQSLDYGRRVGGAHGALQRGD